MISTPTLAKAKFALNAAFFAFWRERILLIATLHFFVSRMGMLIDVLPLTRAVLGPFGTPHFLLFVGSLFGLASCQHLLNQTELESESWTLGLPVWFKRQFITALLEYSTLL